MEVMRGGAQRGANAPLCGDFGEFERISPILGVVGCGKGDFADNLGALGFIKI